MSLRARVVGWVAGVVLVAFGVGCLNYTKAGALEHHRRQADRYGLPEPGPAILFGGAASLVLGGGMLGFSLGRRR